MRFYTYVHLKETTGEPFYVGKGKGDRAVRHVNRSLHWRNVVAKHGHTVQILREWDSEDEAFEHEKLLISQYRSMGYPLVNLTDGGEGASGLQHSEEFRARMSEARKGKIFTPETRTKLSEAHKGKSPSPETRARMSEARKGRKGRSHTPETRAKISEALKGKSITPEARAKMSETRKGRIWINNGVVAKTFKLNEPLPEGFVLGRLKPAFPKRVLSPRQPDSASR